jgi:hypothetical protein
MRVRSWDGTDRSLALGFPFWTDDRLRPIDGHVRPSRCGHRALSRPDALDTLAALTPLHYGGLAVLGLTAGLPSWMLELIIVSTGLPWFHPITAGTLYSRLLLLPQGALELCRARTVPTASD